MNFPRALYDEIKNHALTETPRECCGMVAVDRSDQPIRVYRASNISQNPRVSFRVDPEDQIRIYGQIMDAGLAIGAIYHSHPFTGPEPSWDDQTNAYPGVAHLIVGMGRGLVTKAWRFEPSRHEEELVIV